MINFLKKYSGYIILTIAFLVVVFLMSDCGRKPEEPTVKKEYIKGKNDTVFIDREKTVYRYRPVADTVYVIDTSTDRQFVDSSNQIVHRTYEEEYRDSFVSVTVYDSVNGHLLSQRVKIVQHTPFITRVDTSRETITQPEKLRNKIYLGAYGGAAFKDKFLYGASVSLVDKRDNIFTVSGNPLNKTLLFGVQKKVGFRKR